MKSGSKAVKTLLAADAAWLKAYQSKDAHKSAAFFDAQGSMLVPHTPVVRGRNAITKFIAHGTALRDYKIAWRAKKAGIADSSDLGYTSGTYQMSFKDASGKNVSRKGKYLMLWKKQPDGTWKVLFDISNSDSSAS
jgi:ketosteroid isomerase-like protein